MNHIAIIGAGYSGALQAINLLRFGTARITLIERAERPARGAAYSTSYPDHLLNVRAAKMSAFADTQDHFANWLAARGQGDGATFAERRLYGTYLEELLAAAGDAAGGRLRIIKGEAVSVTRDGSGETIGLADGESLQADAVILSVGNLPPERPRVISPELPDDLYVADPWAGDITSGLSDSDQMILIGTGLTAIDAALMLDAAGFKGRILALSRRGLVPRAHEAGPHSVPDLAQEPIDTLSHLLASVRRSAAAIGWPSAVDQLRPHTQALWSAAPVDRRRRFLRHLRPWWDVHRHRIAPEIAARIAAMEAEGRLSFQAGKLVSTSLRGEGAELVWRPRGSGQTEVLLVRRIVNCTGPQGDLARAGEPLLRQLLQDGRVRADPCRIGIDVDAKCRVLDSNGSPSASLYAIGPMTRGALWEIVAVPDLRLQTHQLAQTLSLPA
ncbi:MAG: FAD/NAD(P)-binding protein [Sphingosinicella sp.]|nr:FAD/NAD(P)-binding protein [Sphingosinicella sp.]